MSKALLQLKAPQPEAAATALYERLSKNIDPAYLRLTQQTAASLRDAVADDAPVIAGLRRSRITAALGEGDIAALAFMVMMEAARDAGDDLKAVMAEVKQVNEQKAALRQRLEAQQQLNARTIRGYRAPDAIAATEMSEMDSLRLQLAMDRLAKLMSTLSNMLKKIRDTQDGIIRNLK